MVGDFGPLHNLVVSQNDVAVPQISRSIGGKQNFLDAGGHDTYPLQVLSRAHLFRSNFADKRIRVRKLAHRCLPRHRHKPGAGRSALQLFNQLRSAIQDQNFFSLRRKQQSARKKEERDALCHYFTSVGKPCFSKNAWSAVKMRTRSSAVKFPCLPPGMVTSSFGTPALFKASCKRRECV